MYVSQKHDIKSREIERLFDNVFVAKIFWQIQVSSQWNDLEQSLDIHNQQQKKKKKQHHQRIFDWESIEQSNFPDSWVWCDAVINSESLPL